MYCKLNLRGNRIIDKVELERWKHYHGVLYCDEDVIK